MEWYGDSMHTKCLPIIHVHVCTCVYAYFVCSAQLVHGSCTYMYIGCALYCHDVQSLRQGKARQLRLKTAPLFPKRKRRAASGGIRTLDACTCTCTCTCTCLCGVHNVHVRILHCVICVLLAQLDCLGGPAGLSRWLSW